MRIGVAATPAVAIPTLEWLLKSDHDLWQIISTPDQPAGRGKILTPSAVSEWADKHDIPLVKTRDTEILHKVFSDVDLVVVIGFGVIFPPHVLSAPKYGCINLHFSLLPQWRGAAPLQRALINGESHLGVSVFQLDEGVDTGPVFSTKAIDVDEDATFGEVLELMARLGVDPISEAIAMIAEGRSPIEQSKSGMSIAPKILRDETRIDWSKSAEKNHHLVRGLSPEPSVWTTWRNENIQIRRTSKTSETTGLKPGDVAIIDGALFAGCGGDSALEIRSVVPAGKREMSGKEWANGARIASGDKFV
ncbi:unannotated protein [freshwater metagenome]|uniref:methionyl-tRNA formyltransferase n=1 Tax=freshwater metagenome TaxID=449393 RepID=A0A6J7N1V6_9ZZZZ|nr:methionyl-tRNA formyltransferase [Actinomycetota bacterium]MSW23011.1 methionyl-tRNA formyltransferase [Actinomycetota bacterium]MSW75548.1 methionyl-tRNA formyltransferase [Actinomycetota bacterium]MSY30491.1 methionyl-tRNA formyltransferase [Actinomycetota bacterium]